jgi:hypothetical protein
VDALATVDDVHFTKTADVPAALPKNPTSGIGRIFTPSIREVLRKQAIAGYFGTRVKVVEMVAAAEKSAEAEDMALRFDNSSAIVTQIGAPHGATTEAELAKFMKNWDDFVVDHPREAQVLEPIHQWWKDHHPGGSGKKAEVAAPAEVTRSDKPAKDETPAK